MSGKGFSSTEKAFLILLDIEGATTSISFVKDELFPFARAHAFEHLKDTWSNEETQDTVGDLIHQITEDIDNNVKGSQSLPPFPENGDNDKFIEALFENIESMMDADRKIGPLKKLQGQIWRQGYFKGQLKGHVYDDAVCAMKKWKETDKKIYIYSSGSVEAQKLLFKYSAFGDLLHLIDGHFDTSIGPKIDNKSYEKISEEVQISPENILFITDLSKEARAAKNVGYSVVLSRRPGTLALEEDDLRDFTVVDSFSELFSEAEETKGLKRKLNN